ncbi:MAG: carboxypeptidase regulatory-like domain-containing protein [Acidimicrobiales bacterium]|nr:carboxypeptidase regulatory-like domain-containing protein [Acidimicrobiales bacterium]
MPTRALRPIAVLVAVVAVLALLVADPSTVTPVAAEDPTGLTSLSAVPAGLDHAFSAGSVDYVVRCQDHAVTLTGTLAAGHELRAVPLGPEAGGPTRLTGPFTYVLPAPGVQAVRLEVSATAAPGTILATYRVRCLPPDFPQYTASVTGTPQAAYYLVTGSYVTVLNAEGTPVWWLRSPGSFDAKIVDHQMVSTTSAAASCPTTPGPGNPYVFRSWNGTPTRTVEHGLDLHDLQATPDGDLLGFQCVNSARGLLEEARLVALDGAGDETWAWRTEDHLSPSEFVPAGYKSTFAHVVAVEPDGDDHVVFTARNLDAVYSVDATTGEIAWKLGGTDTPASLGVWNGTRLLTPIEVQNMLAGPNDARILGDGTLSVLDNGSSALERRPRILRFDIDLDTRVATPVEVVSDARAGYSGGVGSGRRLSGGNWVAEWGFGLDGANRYFTELTPSGTPVLTVTGLDSYRAVPAEPGEIDTDDLHDGFDEMMGTPPGVSGLATDAATGAPIPGAWVALLRTTDFSLAGSAVADGAGSFRAEASPGTYFVYGIDPTGAHQAGFSGGPTPVTVDTGDPAAADVALTSTRGSIAGSVTDRTTGAPISGALAIELNAATGMPGRGVLTDAAGQFSIDGLTPGNRLVAYVDPPAAHASQFYADTSDPSLGTRVVVTAGTTATASVTMPAQSPAAGAHPLTGVVTESGTGDPVSGVLVAALRAADYSLAKLATTDGSGQYSMSVPPAGYFLAFVDPSGRHAQEWHDDVPYYGLAQAAAVTAPAATNAALDVTTAIFSGVITDRASGEPLDGAWVVAIGPTGIAGGAVTATDGTYRIDGLPPGTYRATVVHPAGGHLQQYWNDHSTYDTADPIALAAGDHATVDVSLVASP